jgi:hypothetical protein
MTRPDYRMNKVNTQTEVVRKKRKKTLKELSPTRKKSMKRGKTNVLNIYPTTEKKIHMQL